MTANDAPARADTRAWVGLGVLMVPVFMAALDMTVLFLAIPRIGADLLPSGTQQLWILHIGDIAGASLVLTAGRLVDRFGPRRLLVLGMLAYGAASTLAALATTAEMLVLARGLLGASAVTMAPAGMALLRRMFPIPRQFATAVALFMAAFSAGMALGPPIGGLLLEHFWWGSIFLVNVPAAAAVAVLATRLLPRVNGSGQGGVDVPSIGLSALGITGVVYGAQETAANGWQPWTSTAAVAGLAFLTLFVWRQRRLETPLLDLALLRSVPLVVSLLAIWLVITASAGADLQLAQHLQVVVGHSPLAAGALLVVPAAASVVATAAAPGLLRWLSPGSAILAGVLLALLGAAGMVAALTHGAGTVALVATASVVAAGVAPVFVLGTNLVLAHAPMDRAGSAQAMQEVAGSLGNTSGIALGGTVAYLGYSGTLQQSLPAGLDPALAEVSTRSIGGALAAAEQLPPAVAAQLVEAAQTAFTVATRDAYVVAAAGLAILAVLVLRGLRGARIDGTSDD